MLMIRLHSIFRDHMVFQANKPVRIFGIGSGEVRVSFLGEEKALHADGEEWLVELKPQSYGGPFSMELSLDGRAVTLNDIMIGEVLLCAGQSNMQFTMAEEATPPSAYESDAFLRTYTVDRPEDNKPLTPKDGWVCCDAESVGRWSALGYLTGRCLRQKGVPAVGIVLCAQGASVIQSWMDVDSLKMPEFQISQEKLFEDHIVYSQWNAPSFLYETMLKTVTPFSFGNVVWYQGESNASPDEGAVYVSLLRAMIQSWRREDCDVALPFVVVQIADTRQDEGWLAVQKAQEEASVSIPLVRTVVSADVCEKEMIHPVTKGRLAARIADAVWLYQK